MTKKSQARISAVMDRWKTGLGLSAEQSEKLLEIVTARESEMQQVRKLHKGADNKELRASKLAETRKKYRPSMRGLLDEGQRQKLKVLNKERKSAKSG